MRRRARQRFAHTRKIERNVLGIALIMRIMSIVRIVLIMSIRTFIFGNKYQHMAAGVWRNGLKRIEVKFRPQHGVSMHIRVKEV